MRTLILNYTREEGALPEINMKRAFYGRNRIRHMLRCPYKDVGIDSIKMKSYS